MKRLTFLQLGVLALCATVGGPLNGRAAAWKIDKVLPPQIQKLPVHDTSRIQTYIANSREVPIFPADANEFVQEQIRFREMVRTLLDGADTQQLGFLVERCPPQRAAPQLRSDERPTILQTMVKLGEPFFATDFDAQSRYEQILTLPAPLAERYQAVWANPAYEIVGEMSVLDDRAIEVEREGEVGILMNIFKQVFEPSIRRQTRVELSVLRFTLRVRSGKTRFFVPGVESRFSAVVGRWTGATRVGLIVGNSGGSISGTATYTDGMDSAADALVSRATLTVLAKLLGLPIHRVIRNTPLPDPEVLRAERIFFGRMQSGDQMASIQYLLGRNGYSVPKSGVLDESTRMALADFAGKQEIGDGSANLMGIYLRLLEVTPLPLEPVGGSAQSPTVPSGVSVVFQGFPAGDAPAVSRMVHNVAGSHPVEEVEGNPFRFVVQYTGRPEQLGKHFPSTFFQLTRRNCTVEVLDGRRLVVRHHSGFSE
jgi:hypothetical protein